MTLNQTYFALDLLDRYKEFMSVYAPSNNEKHKNMLVDAIIEASEKKYKYLLALIYNKQAKELEELLSSMGVPRETLIDPQLL